MSSNSIDVIDGKAVVNLTGPGNILITADSYESKKIYVDQAETSLNIFLNKINKTEINSFIPKYSYVFADQELEQKINDILHGRYCCRNSGVYLNIDNYASNTEKIKACYSWVIANLYYDADVKVSNFRKRFWERGLSAIKIGYGTCTDYTIVFTMLMLKLGFHCYVTCSSDQQSEKPYTCAVRSSVKEEKKKIIVYVPHVFPVMDFITDTTDNSMARISNYVRRKSYLFDIELDWSLIKRKLGLGETELIPYKVLEKKEKYDRFYLDADTATAETEDLAKKLNLAYVMVNSDIDRSYKTLFLPYINNPEKGYWQSI